MAESLADRGHEVHVVTYHLGREVEDKRIRVHRIRDVKRYRRVTPGPSLGKLLLLDPLLALKLRSVLRSHQIDVIHAHHYEGLLVARARRCRGIPVIYDAHTLLASELPFYGTGVGARAKRLIGGLFDRYLPGRASHVIAVTDKIRDRLIEIGAVPPERISVVTNGVGPARFDAATRFASNGQRTVVFAGNLASYQGIAPLLHAFRHIRDHRSDVRLQIVSESSFSDYEDLAASLGIRDAIDIVNVPFEELAPYLVSADVAVNPRSDGEGVPQKLMNYMAAGRPIVSFEGSAAHLEHEKTALLIPNHDTRAFALGIEQVLDHPELAASLGSSARSQVDEQYSWDRTAERTEGIYHRLLRSRGETEQVPVSAARGVMQRPRTVGSS